MTLGKLVTLLVAVLGTASFLPAQVSNGIPAESARPTFKGHRIGESAQEFFAIAKASEKDGVHATDFCRAYLTDPKVKKALERARRKGADDASSMMVATNIEGCNNVQAALAGRDVEVDARFAAEFGSGRVTFVAGHLASVRFVVKAQFNDVVEDMTSKLSSTPKLDTETLQNGVGAIVKQRQAAWTLPHLVVKLAEVHSLEGEDIGTEVSVSDPALMKSRANSLN